MQWITHGERSLYDSHWVNLCLVDVEQPDGRRWEHHVIRMRHLAVVGVVNEAHEVLLVWRHRFVTNTWAWELPSFLPGFLRQVCQLRDDLPDFGRRWRYISDDARPGFGVTGCNRPDGHFLN